MVMMDMPVLEEIRIEEGALPEVKMVNMTEAPNVSVLSIGKNALVVCESMTMVDVAIKAKDLETLLDLSKECLKALQEIIVNNVKEMIEIAEAIKKMLEMELDIVVPTVEPTGVVPTSPTEEPTVSPTAAPTTIPTATPTTVAPTTAVPTTVAPTMATPTTVAPTTVAPTTVTPTIDPSLILVTIVCEKTSSYTLEVYSYSDLETPVQKSSYGDFQEVMSVSFKLPFGNYIFVHSEDSGDKAYDVAVSIRMGASELEHTCHATTCPLAVSYTSAGIAAAEDVATVFSSYAMTSVYKDDLSSTPLFSAESLHQLTILHPGMYYIVAGYSATDVFLKSVHYSSYSNTTFSVLSDGFLYFHCRSDLQQITVYQDNRSTDDEVMLWNYPYPIYYQWYYTEATKKGVFGGCLLPGDYLLEMYSPTTGSSATVTAGGLTVGTFTKGESSKFTLTIPESSVPKSCEEGEVLTSLTATQYPRYLIALVETGEEFLLSFDSDSTIDVCLKKDAPYRIRELGYPGFRTHLMVRTADGVKGEFFFKCFGEGWFHTAEGRREPSADYHGFYLAVDASQLSAIPKDVEFLAIAPSYSGEHITANLTLSQFSKLELLYVYNLYPSSSVEVKDLPRLKQLALYGRSYGSNAPSSVVVQGCPSLTTLTIEDYKDVPSVVIKGISVARSHP